MEKEKKVKKDVAEVADVKQFDFGTLVLTCKCGRKQSLMEHIEHGIQFIIATNDKAGITLHCDECHSELRLHCEEGTPPPETAEVPKEVEEIISEESIDENVPEENKEGESL